MNVSLVTFNRAGLLLLALGWGTASVSAQTAEDAVGAAQRGAKVFKANCVACHAPTLAADDRKNLTDGVWYHVKSPADVTLIIENGLPAEGMPGFKAVLRPAQRANLAAYILSLAKAPQTAAP